MKYILKKFSLSLLAVFVFCFGAQSATTSVTIPPGVMTNFTLLSQGSLKVTQVILTASTATNTTVQLWDTYTNQTLFTNTAYSNILTYVTNYVSTWTNYYGVTNKVTNTASLVDITNLVAGTTNSFNQAMVLSAVASTSIRVDAVNYYFQNGLWITNTSSGNAVVTITYQQ